MKKLPFAAAALLLGTSAYAMIPSTHEDAHMVAPTAAVDPAYDEAPSLQPAAAETWTAAETAGAADKADAQLVADDGDADWAAAAQAKLDAAGSGEAATLQPASLETGFSDDAAVAAETAAMAGTGGPDEAVETAAAPRAAAQNYPACRPGPGDDRCIQLYERGVQQQLASWTQPTGGFARSGDTQVAMGGPYEPVDSATETERLNQQALADSTRAVQMAEAAAVTTDEQALDSAQADEAGTQVAMGGPYEPVAEDAAMNGDGSIDTAMGETAGNEDVGEV